MRTSMVRAAVATTAALGVCGCTYLRLLRPSVLRQLNPPTAELVNYLPKVDHPNDAIVGRLFAQGGLARARAGADGVMRTRVRVRNHAGIWEPSILVMPRAGTLEVQVQNEDEGTHIAYFPSDAADQVLVLPSHTAGTLRVTLEAPGLYSFADGAGDTVGRGMLGVIIVEGDVPADARLTRGPQPQPKP